MRRTAVVAPIIAILILTSVATALAQRRGGFGGGGGRNSQIGGGDSFIGEVAFGNSGALANPSVGGVHHFFEVGVIEHLGREVTGDSGDFCSDTSGHAAPFV